MGQNTKQIIFDFVDFLMPELTPYESSLYLYFLRNTVLEGKSNELRVGKRTIAKKYGIGIKGQIISFKNVTKQLENLERKGCIKIGNSTRMGTLFSVILPRDTPLVAEKIASISVEEQDEDYFTDTKKRQVIFETDKWICQYCGEKVAPESATLDHYIPQSKNGKHNKENLRTCCFMCNSVKSGKTYEEAAPLLLKKIKERKQQ